MIFPWVCVLKCVSNSNCCHRHLELYIFDVQKFPYLSKYIYQQSILTLPHLNFNSIPNLNSNPKLNHNSTFDQVTLNLEVCGCGGDVKAREQTERVANILTKVVFK